MKKICLLFLIFIILPVNATQWVEFAHKSYYDEDTWKQNGNYVTVWFKILNNGDFPLENNKKVWYQTKKIIADCGNFKIAPLSTTSYDLSGKVIKSFDFDTSRYYSYDNWLSSLYWMNVAPDTLGMLEYNLMCGVRN